MTTEETLTGLRDMATYDCGFEEQSDIALAAADAIVTLLVEVTSLRKQLDAAVEDMKQTHCIGTSCYICKQHGKCERERVEIGHCALFEWRSAERSE